jgi:glycosyltransferase involved in cell wall biosynthesis
MTDSVRGPASVVACTVVRRDHLPSARVLARSYLRHHPHHEFVVLVADGATPRDARSDHRVVGYDWLTVDPDEYLRMATCCSADELVAAATPLLVRRLLDDCEAVVVLAASIAVLAPFPEVATAATGSGLVLLPQVLAPPPADGRNPGDDRWTRAAGFDPGFLAVGRGGKAFLDFWNERALAEMLRPPAVVRSHEPTVQRSWLDEVPALFAHDVLRDPGFGLAYWNLHERELTESGDGTVSAAGSPARFVNFAGYDPETPWLLSADCRDRPRVVLSAQPTLRRLCDAYRADLLAEGHRSTTVTGDYRFGVFADGSPITLPMRGAFREALRRAERTAVEQVPFAGVTEAVPPHPFGQDDGAGFARWLGSPGSPAEAGAGFNRLTMWLWSRRVDLQGAFPQPLYDSAEGYRNWCRTHGVTDGPLPEWALPREPPEPAPPVDEFGVNVAGYLTAELGLGEMGRIVHRVARQADIPVASVVEDHSLSRLVRTGLARPDTTGRPKYPVSIIAVNADYTALVLGSHPEIGHQRYRIGLWAWELEDFPTPLHTAFDLVDEVWTISEFCRTAIAAHATVPVKVFPMPVADPGEPDRPTRRPGDVTRFLFAFDFNSTGQRKNPWGLVEAFRRAFPGRDDVRLVIKATNAHLHAPAAERLRYLVDGDSRVQLMERYLSVEELDDLYASSDAYVSLHRSEGFGLTVAEAMIRGMPVISTDYSSTAEFVDDTVGWPIPCTMVDVGEGWAPYHAEARWAEPDLAAAAAAMREVADDPAEAARRGAAAREHLLRTRSADAAAAWTREQVTAAYRTWRDREEGDDTVEPDDTPATPLDRARMAVHSEADPTAPSRIPFAPTMRRMVRRAIDHYDAHQRTVLDALADGVRDAVATVAQRLDRTTEAHERRLDAVESATRTADRGIASLTERLADLEDARRQGADAERRQP